MTGPLVFLNGRFLPFHQAALPLADAGFVSGATVVDNARTFRQKLFRWPDHLARFRRDCTACTIPLELEDDAITASAEELVAHNAALLPPGSELQLVTFATPGQLGFYLGAEENGPPTLGMATYPLPVARYRRWFTDGVLLAVVGHQAADPTAIVSPLWKHRSRMAWWIADRRQRQADTVAILTDRPGGTLTETAVANFLAVFDGVVTSPPRDKVLDGISLRVVEELCGMLRIPFTQREIPVADAVRMDEAFVTGTGFCVAGVRRIDAIEVPWPGPIYRQLLAAWSDLVGINIEMQFTG